MDLTKFVETAKPLGLLGIRVTQQDEDIAEWHLEAEYRRNVYSVSKSFTACAVGFAVQEGLLSLEERLVDVFPDELPPVVSDHLKKARVRDLLTMCLGQESANLMSDRRPYYEDDNWVRLSLAIPFVYEPGTHFVYNNVGPYLAGMLVQRWSGCDLVSYLMPRLFSHLGFKRPTWETDPYGNTFGSSGLLLTLSEMHTFGLFCLHKGAWNGKQVLSRAWLEECARQQSDAPYGYCFWRGEYGSFRADGKYCQLAIMLPGRDAVVSLMAECRREAEMKRAVYDLVCAQL